GQGLPAIREKRAGLLLRDVRGRHPDRFQPRAARRVRTGVRRAAAGDRAAGRYHAGAASSAGPDDGAAHLGAVARYRLAVRARGCRPARAPDVARGAVGGGRAALFARLGPPGPVAPLTAGRASISNVNVIYIHSEAFNADRCKARRVGKTGLDRTDGPRLHLVVADRPRHLGLHHRERSDELLERRRHEPLARNGERSPWHLVAAVAVWRHS